MGKKKELTDSKCEQLIELLKNRFNNNIKRHQGLDWGKVEKRLKSNPNKLWSLNEMEISGGEPDVIKHDQKSGEVIFYDCSKESPVGRRSLCYDKEALDSRKEFKPINNAIDMAKEMGVEILTEEQYRELQTVGNFDNKTSSWIFTPPEIRKLGGAIFADFRYNKVFIYHNGASSYYAARAFRSSLAI